MKFCRYIILCFSLMLVSCGDKKEGILTSADEVQNSVGELEAEITGMVVVEPGLFDGFFTDKGFAISQPSVGVYISSDTLKNVKRGDKVTVTGKTSDLYKMRVVKLAATKAAADFKFTPSVVFIAIDQIDDYYIGRMVKIRGTISEFKSDLPYGWQMSLQETGNNDKDGDAAMVFISSTSKIDPRTNPKFAEGQNVEVVGFFIKYQNKLKVLPRDMKDINFLGAVEKDNVKAK